mmetsp:Transcript_67582/g.128620  ORF Transcript_67582/g.128620 Transcript_67582/m.128620 type:complete len:640 (-) Transcript_67582:93-2012(-)
MKIESFTVFAALVLCGSALSLRYRKAALPHRNGRPSLFQAGLPLLQDAHNKEEDSLKILEEMEATLLRLPLPENSSKKQEDNVKTLDDMEATLFRMAKSGNVSTPLKEFTDLIRPHLHSMEAAINNSHTSDQNTADNLGTLFTTCTTAKTTADTEASTLLTAKTEKSTAHKECRTAESTAQANYQRCMTELRSLERAGNASCSNNFSSGSDIDSCKIIPKPAPGQSYQSWLLSMKDWVDAELADVKQKIDSCNSSTDLYTTKKAECEGADGNGGLKQAWTNLKTLCSANQTALEATACSYAGKVEDSCSNYATCYSSANSAYNSGSVNLLSAQANRVLEYELVKRLKCFSNLFSAADGGDLDDADINSCKNANHSTTHLLLTLPTVPFAPVTCQDVDPKPCTTNYISTEYGSLPSNAQAATCQVCPSAITTALTTTTTPTTTTQPPLWTTGLEGYIDKENRAFAKLSVGSLSSCEEHCRTTSQSKYFCYSWGQFHDSDGSADCMCAKPELSAANMVADNTWVKNEACVQSSTNYDPSIPGLSSVWCVYPTGATAVTTTAAAVDCTTQTDAYGSAGCLPYADLGVNGKPTAKWNYCVYPTQAIADAGGATLSAVVDDHQWMIASCEKTCCEYPDLSSVTT